MWAYFTQVLEDVLAENRGDLFAMPLAAFDRFVRRGGSADESLLRRGFAVFLLLIGLRQLFPGKPKKKKTGPEA